MSDTPETDGEWNRIACYEHPRFEQALADFARKMERERDDFRDELNDTIRLSLIWEDGYRALLDERDLWKAEAEKWRAIADDYRN